MSVRERLKVQRRRNRKFECKESEKAVNNPGSVQNVEREMRLDSLASTCSEQPKGRRLGAEVLR